MKKTALLAAAAALFMATPAMAQSGGSVGLGYNNIEEEGDVYQLDGAFGASGGSIGYQIDAGLGQVDDDVDTQTIAGHLYWNGGGWRLGGVIAHTNLEADGGDGLSETVYGVEGTWNLGPNAVVLGSYTVGESEFIVDVDTWNADLGLNYYLSDNLRIGGAIGFGNLEAGGSDLDTNGYRLNAEWQPWTTPVSFTLGWNSFELDSSDSVDSVSVGARWNWGGTLRERDNATPFDTRTGLYQRLYDIR